MADITISNLPAITTATSDDVLILNDGDLTTSKITWGELQASVSTLSNPVSFADGTASLPAITNIGDTNTGIFFPEAESLAISTNGSQRFVVSPNGNVGVDCTNPDDFTADGNNLVIGDLTSSGNGLTIVSAPSNNSGLFFADGTGVGEIAVGKILYEHANNNLSFHTDGAEAFRVDDTGNIGVGSTSPQELIHVKAGTSGVSGGVDSASGIIVETGISDNGSLQFQSYPNTTAGIHFGDSDNKSSGLISYDHSTDALTFSTSGSDHAFIAGDGSFTIGHHGHAASFTISRNTNSAAYYGSICADTEIQSGVTDEYYGYRSDPSTEATSFNLSTLKHFTAQQGTIGAGSSVTDQYGYYAAASLVGGTNNYGFYSSVPGAAGNWAFYGAGSAESYFGGEITSPGTYNNTTADAANLHIDATGKIFRSSSSLRYKKNVETLTDAEADVILNGLRPVTFHSNDQDLEEVGHLGLIAEEVAEVDPRLAHFDSEGRPDGVQYDRVVSPLLQLVQRQQRQIEELTARLEKAGL